MDSIKLHIALFVEERRLSCAKLVHSIHNIVIVLRRL